MEGEALPSPPIACWTSPAVLVGGGDPVPEPFGELPVVERYIFVVQPEHDEPLGFEESSPSPLVSMIVRRPVQFDHDSGLEAGKVRNPGPNWDLSSETHAKLLVAYAKPQSGLADRHRLPIISCELTGGMSVLRSRHRPNVHHFYPSSKGVVERWRR